jgi:hypothetical protein
MCADLGPDLGVAVWFCSGTTSPPNRYIFRAYSSGSPDFAKRSRASLRCVCERTVLTGRVACLVHAMWNCIEFRLLSVSNFDSTFGTLRALDLIHRLDFDFL